MGESPKAYTVTSVDTLTNRYEDIAGGFLIWNLTQGTYNPLTDNAELMIADYVEPGADAPEPPAPPTPLLVCSVRGRDRLMAGMGPRPYEAVFYGEDGASEVTGQSAVWSVEVPHDHQEYVSWEARGETLMLSATEQADGCRITLLLKDVLGQYRTARLDVEVTTL